MVTDRVRRLVVLRRERGMVLVDPPAAAVVRAALTEPGRVYDPATARWVGRGHLLWYPDVVRRYGAAMAQQLGHTDDGVTAFPAGLLPRARAALEAAGFRVRVVDDPYWTAPRPALDRYAVGRLPDGLYEVVDGLRTGGPRLT